MVVKLSNRIIFLWNSSLLPWTESDNEKSVMEKGGVATPEIKFVGSTLADGRSDRLRVLTFHLCSAIDH